MESFYNKVLEIFNIFITISIAAPPFSLFSSASYFFSSGTKNSKPAKVTPIGDRIIKFLMRNEIIN